MQSFTEDSFYNLNILQNIVALDINAKVNLKKQDSYVRIILLDKTGKQWLVYQAGFPFENINTLTNICEETCIMPIIQPDKLLIELSNDSSSIILNEINYLPEE